MMVNYIHKAAFKRVWIQRGEKKEIIEHSLLGFQVDGDTVASHTLNFALTFITMIVTLLSLLFLSIYFYTRSSIQVVYIYASMDYNSSIDHMREETF